LAEGEAAVVGGHPLVQEYVEAGCMKGRHRQPHEPRVLKDPAGEPNRADPRSAPQSLAQVHDRRRDARMKAARDQRGTTPRLNVLHDARYRRPPVDAQRLAGTDRQCI
jgi:hypothetical protein